MHLKKLIFKFIIFKELSSLVGDVYAAWILDILIFMPRIAESTVVSIWAIKAIIRTRF